MRKKERGLLTTRTLQLKFCVNQRLKAEEKGKILACVGTF
jgi:hypothetical protein